MKLRPDKDKDAGGGLILPGREMETVASAPDEFPSWYPSCADCVHFALPAGAAPFVFGARAMWSVGLCGKFRGDDGQPSRGIWYERYGLAPSFNDLTGEAEGPVKIGRCGPRAEYFERRK